ncbi:MAG: DUF1318 domain-containing protein [Terrimicrobiaceae bacterium]|nr:DUF1318 domain-containing protein [Terrimicrobiaceae bacterium]
MKPFFPNRYLQPAKFFLLVGMVLFLALNPRAWASELEDLKRSVQLRAEAVATLKQQGILREGPDGLLVADAGLPVPQKRLLDEENSDRARIFAIIASERKTSLTDVAAQFARMAAAKNGPAATQPPTQALPPVQSKRDDAPRGSSPLPGGPSAKVIIRPSAVILAGPERDARVVRNDVPAFSIWYVSQRKGDWFEITASEGGAPAGWVSARDAIEWKQNLVVSFTHPDGRKPVLFFKDEPGLERLVGEPASARRTSLASLYSAIETGAISPEFPVEAMEPARAVNARDQFYLLPIVNYREAEIDGREGRLLQLSALTRKRGTGSLDDPRARGDATRKSNYGKAGNVKVDIVFVMDMTRSMGPFITKTLEMIEGSMDLMKGEPAVANAIRFGMWGFRDSPEACPGIGFNTKNFTPALQDMGSFAKTLSGVEETRVDSKDYEEDVFAGMADGIEKTAWREGALRLIVLVGDAPGRPPGATGKDHPNGPKGTASGMDAESIRRLADSANVYVSSIYLGSPKWETYAETGEEQFRLFSRNPNSRPGAENFRKIDATDPALYGETSGALAVGLLEFMKKAVSGELTEGDLQGRSPVAEVVDTGSAKQAGLRLASDMFRGAMVQWLGSVEGAEVPPDVTGWAADKDLSTPAVQALDVQVFLTKNQLNNLKVMLDRVADAGIRGKISGEDFFDALRSVVAATARDPDKIPKAETLAQAGLVPAFLQGLPYQSTVMAMTDENWKQLSPDAQSQFINTVMAKLGYYQTIHDNPERWVALNPEDSSDAWVAAIPLDQLP